MKIYFICLLSFANLAEQRAWSSRLYLAQALSGHGCFNAYLRRFKKRDEEMCCYYDFPVGTTKHASFVCAKWDVVRVFILYLLDYYKPQMPPFYTQGTHAPSSGSFLTKYLAELHFGNGYMEIGLLISNLHVWNQPFVKFKGGSAGGVYNVLKFPVCLFLTYSTMFF